MARFSLVSLTCLSVLLVSSACASGEENMTSITTFGSSFTTAPTATSDSASEDSESGDDPGGDGDGDPAGDGDGDDPTTTNGDGDGDDPTTTSGDGDGDDPTTTSGDGDGDDPTTTGDGDGEPPETCGNGVLDPGETCDGNDFGGFGCADLGYDGGNLLCDVNCGVDPSACTNTAQPGLGQLYSHCLIADNCPGLDGCVTVSMQDMEPFDGFCTNFCVSDADCNAGNPGGNAVPQCNDAPDPYCELDCAGGLTCPQGMECTALQGGTFLCY